MIDVATAVLATRRLAAVVSTAPSMRIVRMASTEAFPKLYRSDAIRAIERSAVIALDWTKMR